MNHLTVDEIIEFVSCCEMNDESVGLIKSVNEHIRKCPECFKLVRAFQTVYYEFETMCLYDDFRSYLSQRPELVEMTIFSEKVEAEGPEIYK